MTNKDFEMIASCVHSADFGPLDDWQTADRRLKHAQTLADNFALVNPRFDRAKFIAACMKGVGQ
jgi:hypothetical protein